MIEHERSYVFTHEGAHGFLESSGLGLKDLSDTACESIEDYYLGKGMRVRKSKKVEDDVYSFVFTRKTGEKAKGYRFEFEEEISEDLATQLMAESIMQVKKTRIKLNVPNNIAYAVTMDFIDKPMKLAVLEIEALNEVVFPIPADITTKLFGIQLKECPLCTYKLFNRRIGIAGGPSSCISETAKSL